MPYGFQCNAFPSVQCTTYTGRLCSTGLARTLNNLPKLTVVEPLLAVK